MLTLGLAVSIDGNLGTTGRYANKIVGVMLGLGRMRLTENPILSKPAWRTTMALLELLPSQKRTLPGCLSLWRQKQLKRWRVP